MAWEERIKLHAEEGRKKGSVTAELIMLQSKSVWKKES